MKKKMVWITNRLYIIFTGNSNNIEMSEKNDMVR